MHNLAQGGQYLYGFTSSVASHKASATTLIMSNLYDQLKSKTVALVEAMYNLPGSPVWVHKNVLYNVIGITSSDTFGKKDVMTYLYLLNGIKKGYFGNRRTDSIKITFDASDLSQESKEQCIQHNIPGPWRL